MSCVDDLQVSVQKLHQQISELSSKINEFQKKVKKIQKEKQDHLVATSLIKWKHPATDAEGRSFQFYPCPCGYRAVELKEMTQCSGDCDSFLCSNCGKEYYLKDESDYGGEDVLCIKPTFGHNPRCKKFGKEEPAPIPIPLVAPPVPASDSRWLTRESKLFPAFGVVSYIICPFCEYHPSKTEEIIECCYGRTPSCECPGPEEFCGSYLCFKCKQEFHILNSYEEYTDINGNQRKRSIIKSIRGHNPKCKSESSKLADVVKNIDDTEYTGHALDHLKEGVITEVDEQKEKCPCVCQKVEVIKCPICGDCNNGKPELTNQPGTFFCFKCRSTFTKEQENEAYDEERKKKKAEERTKGEEMRLKEQEEHMKHYNEWKRLDDKRIEEFKKNKLNWYKYKEDYINPDTGEIRKFPDAPEAPPRLVTDLPKDDPLRLDFEQRKALFENGGVLPEGTVCETQGLREIELKKRDPGFERKRKHPEPEELHPELYKEREEIKIARTMPSRFNFRDEHGAQWHEFNQEFINIDTGEIRKYPSIQEIPPRFIANLPEDNPMRVDFEHYKSMFPKPIRQSDKPDPEVLQQIQLTTTEPPYMEPYALPLPQIKDRLMYDGPFRGDSEKGIFA